MRRLNNLVRIGAVALLSASMTLTAFGSSKNVNVHTIRYVESLRGIDNFSGSIIDKNIHSVKDHKVKDFIGYVLETTAIEDSYQEGVKTRYNSPRFYQDNSGDWHLLSESVKLPDPPKEGEEPEEVEYTPDQFVTNKWFMDTDGRWYAFDSSGNIIAGIVRWAPVYIEGFEGEIPKEYFILNPEDDEYGALVHQNGYYVINDNVVHLTFGNYHNDYYGFVSSGATSIK